MYAYIRGTLSALQQTQLIIEAAGIGYRIFIPLSCLEQLPPIGKEVILHLSYVLKESGPLLYGFPTSNERDLFELLLTASGVGPKIAMSLLSHFTPSQLRQVILAKEQKQLLRVPGLGKKSIERLFIELSDKLALWIPAMESVSLGSSQQRSAEAESFAVGDAIQALIHLGYSQVIAQRAIKKALEEQPHLADLPSLITAALPYAQ